MVEHCEVGAFAQILEDFFCAGASRIWERGTRGTK